MKCLPLFQLHQVYSNSLLSRPKDVWVIDLESEGVLSEVIEQCVESSTGWTGWGFNLVPNTDSMCTTACLLFEHREDAVMTKLIYGAHLDAY